MFPLAPPSFGVDRRPVVAVGGVISDIPGFRVHSFTGSGTFQIVSASGPVVLEYLVIGAGAGAGANNNGGAYGGGGGAGGFLSGATTRGVGSYAVTVGAAGYGGNVASDAMGGYGGNSAFDGITAIGGGRGAYSWWNGTSYGSYYGGNGGSGGGVGFQNDGNVYIGGQYTAGQGWEGGSGYSGGAGSSGGGAGGAGYFGGSPPGKTSSIRGSVESFSLGGPVGTYVQGYGSGGGSLPGNSYGGNAGIVIVRYAYP